MISGSAQPTSAVDTPLNSAFDNLADAFRDFSFECEKVKPAFASAAKSIADFLDGAPLELTVANLRLAGVSTP